MGYPMTWRRVIQRNGIEAPGIWDAMVNISADVDASVSVSAVRRERIVCYADQVRLLRDDIRRLIQDSQDETAVCAQIYRRTGLATDIVAAVLKEFFSL